MSAEVLRQAAALMRERATKASEEPRTIHDTRIYGVWLNSAHYMTIPPVVALGVAEWLDHCAKYGTWRKHIGNGPTADIIDRATTVAMAYLDGEKVS